MVVLIILPTEQNINSNNIHGRHEQYIHVWDLCLKYDIVVFIVDVTVSV